MLSLASEYTSFRALARQESRRATFLLYFSGLIKISRTDIAMAKGGKGEGRKRVTVTLVTDCGVGRLCSAVLRRPTIPFP
jgi:hypothetical protein